MNSNFLHIFDSLETINWRVAANTYGNSHSTLIGLIAHWWISQSPDDRQVLESAPPHGYVKGEEKVLGQGDALLCQHRNPLGVVEVEGTRWEHTARKIGYYFSSTVSEYQGINFGLLLMYVTGLKGSGEQRRFPRIEEKEVAEINSAVEIVEKITLDHPQKAIIVVTLDKELIIPEDRIMKKSTYYSGRPYKITGKLYTSGNASTPKVFL